MADVTAVLLREAQQEIALLRTDLFNTRRLAEERRQAVEALQSERERLARHCDDVEATLRAANAQLNHVPELQQRCAHLENNMRRLQSELETSIAARRILEQELDDERRQRSALIDQKSMLESERARLAKQRDDLAAQLRVAQKKAREAEEEQVRAEEDAAALRAEVAALQQAAAVASAPVPTPPPSASPIPGVSASGSAAPASSAADTAAAIAASVAAATTPLLEQLEHERNRGTALLGSLHAAKSEIMELSQRLADYEARHADMLARGHHDPEHLSHQLVGLRDHNAHLAAQVAAAEDRARHLEAEASQLRAALDAATAAASSAAVATAAQPHPPAAPGHLPPRPPPATAASEQSDPAGQQQQQQHHPRQTRPESGDGASASSVPSRLLAAAGRITSSGSLYGGGGGEAGGHGGSDEPQSLAQLADEVARLRQQVCRLKASRDKLLSEIDKQWGEIERLSSENASLSDELRAQRTLAANWERQAQDGIAQVEQLKDLLEETARWGPTPAAHAGAPAAPPAAAGAADAAADAGGPIVQSLQEQVLAEKARATELELQLRAVAAELLRCQHSSLDLGKSFLPMMAGVEKRLAELYRRARNV